MSVICTATRGEPSTLSATSVSPGEISTVSSSREPFESQVCRQMSAIWGATSGSADGEGDADSAGEADGDGDVDAAGEADADGEADASGCIASSRVTESCSQSGMPVTTVTSRDDAHASTSSVRPT